MLELNIITTLALHYEPAYHLSSFVIGFNLDFSPPRNKMLSQIHQKILPSYRKIIHHLEKMYHLCNHSNLSYNRKYY
jgi:hypothetical protein